MFCADCGHEINDNAALCLKCGCPVGKPVATGKSRTTYVLLGILLGLFGLPGIHNFYAGHASRGLIQLLGTIFTCWILWIPMLIWAIVEACVETRDGEGNLMS